MIELKGDTISVSLEYQDSISLIFASHKRPGGGYLRHENGQEEWIARRTNVVEKLQEYKDVYGNNKKPFYIILENVTLTEAGVNRHFIACPAPVANLYKNPNYQIELRIKEICKYVKKYNTFITGPFGCGFFGNDKFHVKECFNKYATNPTVIWVEL